MLKIRRPLGRLIFNMGIAIPGKTVFLIETAPWTLCSTHCWGSTKLCIAGFCEGVGWGVRCGIHPDKGSVMLKMFPWHYGIVVLIWYECSYVHCYQLPNISIPLPNEVGLRVYWIHLLPPSVCFGISISNFICMLMLVIGRSLLIFGNVTFKMAAWQPCWIFWFLDCNISLALNISSKL